PLGKTFPLNTQSCWTGIEAGVRTTLSGGSRTTRCWRCMETAKNFGPMRKRTTTCAGFARDGSEPHLLGYKSLYLSPGTERGVFGPHQGTAHSNAQARRPAVNLDNHVRRSIGQADASRRCGALSKV